MKRIFLLALVVGLVGCSDSNNSGSVSLDPQHAKDLPARSHYGQQTPLRKTGSDSVNQQQRKDLPEGSYRMQRAQIMDTSGFGRPLVAYSIFIPVGWQSQGGIIWDQNNNGSCGRAPTRVEWTANAPDGVSYIQLLPEENWSGNNLPNMGMQQQCPNITITTVKDYLQWFVQRERPGARILDYRDRPDLTKEAEAMNRSETTQFGQYSSWVQAGEVLIAYQYQGQDVRESIARIIYFTHNKMAGVMPGEVREFLTLGVLPGLAVRAPHGQLDFNRTETIIRSLSAGPEWQALMNQHYQKMRQINAKGAADRHAIRMDTIRTIGEINQQIYDSRNDSSDRMQTATVRSIRGVDLYSDPVTHQQFELPNTHNSIWKLKDDTFILTNDTTFEPYRDLGLDGHQLEIAK